MNWIKSFLSFSWGALLVIVAGALLIAGFISSIENKSYYVVLIDGWKFIVDHPFLVIVVVILIVAMAFGKYTSAMLNYFDNTKLIERLDNLTINRISSNDDDDDDDDVDNSSKETKDKENTEKQKRKQNKSIELITLERIQNDIEIVNTRINIETQRLSKNATLNLLIGSIATILSVSYLLVVLLLNPPNIDNSNSILSYYISRISIVVFTEIFAFFFLKMYKANQNDLKYLNNEMTTISIKIIALKTAISSKNADIMKITIEELVKTERNFVLKKDESTIELEKHKIESNENTKIIETLKDLVKTATGK